MSTSIPFPIPFPFPNGIAEGRGVIVIHYRAAASSHHHNHQVTKTRRSHEEMVWIGQRPIISTPWCLLCVFVSSWLRRFLAERRFMKCTTSGVQL